MLPLYKLTRGTHTPIACPPARCELLRARAASGMRDKDAAAYAVPAEISSPEAMEALLHYVYKVCVGMGRVYQHVCRR